MDIRNALDDEPTAIIVKPGGKFKEDELDQVLSWYETIGDLYRSGILSCDMIYDEFSYDIAKNLQKR